MSTLPTDTGPSYPCIPDEHEILSEHLNELIDVEARAMGDVWRGAMCMEAHAVVPYIAQRSDFAVPFLCHAGI
jgi:hypothetical protein